jgi:hypothetical protein
LFVCLGLRNTVAEGLEQRRRVCMDSDWHESV